MHRQAILLALALTACGGSSLDVTHEREDAEPAHSEAATEDARPALPEASAEDAASDASPDVHDGGGMLCCSTGQNLLVCDPSMPFTCYPSRPDEVPTSCVQIGCKVGATCSGFNGQGVVVVCGW